MNLAVCVLALLRVIKLYKMSAKVINTDMVINKGKLIKKRYIVKPWLCYI